MLEIQNLTLGYGKNILLRNISAKASPGELIALAGRNGSGKSTLIRAMTGLQKPLAGRILTDGLDIGSLPRETAARKVSIVNTDRVRIPWLKCRDLVALGRAPWTGWTGRLSDRDEEAVNKALELAGMTDFAMRSMDSMSDGECQRIMIARALAQDTPLLVLDEPTAFLDIANRFLVTKLLRDIAHKSGRCVIFSTHDLQSALQMCDRIWVMAGDGFYDDTPGRLMEHDVFNRIFDRQEIVFNKVTRSFETTDDI